MDAWIAIPLLLALAPGCSGSTSSDGNASTGGASGGGGTGGSIEQCVESFTGVTIADACKACLAKKCAQDSTAYCSDPGYSAAKACYASCSTCATDCAVAFNQCSQSCGAGDAACCSTCSSERQSCTSSCPEPACDCVPVGSSLFNAAAGLATCMTFSCVSECSEQIGHC